MATGSVTLGSDYSSVWTQLNTARTRLGVGALSVPDVQGDAATNAQMLEMQNAIESTRTSDSRISSRYSTPVTLTGIDTGDIMKYSIITEATNIAINYQGVPICSCQSHRSDHDDCNMDLYQCGCWGDDGCSGDGGRCPEDCSCHSHCDSY